MGFKEKLESIRNDYKGKINADTSPEELEKINGMLASIDEIEADYTKVSEDNAKYQSTIVRLVSQSGDKTPPKDEEQGKTPRTLEQIFKDVSKEEK